MSRLGKLPKPALRKKSRPPSREGGSTLFSGLHTFELRVAHCARGFNKMRPNL